MKFSTKLLQASAFAAAAFLTQAGHAAFTYNPQDILLGFRNAGANDFVVDIGAASLYYHAAAGSTFTVSGFTGSQLTTAMGGLDGLSFSAFGDVRTTGDASHPQNTLWLTRAWNDAVTHSDPWNRGSQFQQANPAGKIDGIANGALTYSGGVPSDPNNNTATAVLIPKTWNSGGISYSIGVGSGGNLANTFQGSIENTTGTGFAAGGIPLRSDLYELNPGSGPGTYLGFFELGASGSLTFTAVPEPSTFAIIGAGFLALIVLNRSFRKSPFSKNN